MSKTLSIGLAGTFTVDSLTRHLKKALQTKGFDVSKFHVAPYNQLQQLSFQPDALLEGTPDVLIVFWRLEDWKDTLNSFISTIKTLRQNYKGLLIVSNCPYPSSAMYHYSDLQQARHGVQTHAQQLSAVTQELADIENLKILNLAGVIQHIGHNAAHDVRKWYLYKQPYSESVWRKLATLSARTIAAETVAAKKCIVLDCDNTLWGGIIGEDGLGGIEIGADFPGSAFTDFQKYMFHLRAQGIFLAIASKNNEEDVFEVFDKHDAMVLKRKHISSWQVHWRSKVESLQAIANDLNITTDALVFVDDNPKEIAEVKSRLPEVTCFQVPEELAEFPSLLVNSGLFDIANLTEEDGKRTDMMLAENKRKTESAAMSEEEFIQSLELKINIFEAREQHLARITQLINKTNQFNVTTKRRTADEVKALSEADDKILLGMDISDRFGEYGLVGVVILDKQDDQTWLFDSLMMSCRVLGRGAETTMITKAGEIAAMRGGQKLIGEYIPTAKNKMVKNLFERHDFKKDGALWHIDIDDLPQPPDYVEVSVDVP